ncbi:MAG: helix-turn-helix domain-containing protein [Mycobacteriaceae bacterium]|nr:helix-turn-helix domain-containing protein [Mycobacteriaceae bacterium]
MTTAASRRAVRTTQRAELGAFLKSRRARITPADVGLPPGPRRRTPGLRREEVAQLSGIGVTWYTWLEQGRSINVSVQVLDALARTLALDATERAHLYRLADVPTVPGPQLADALPPEMHVIMAQLNPLPGVVLSARYDVLASNSAYEALCPMSTAELNVARRVFLTPPCCNSLPFHRDDLRRMVGYLRAAYAKNLDDPAWQQFISEMCSESREFDELWARNDVAMPTRRTKIVRNLAVGDIELTTTSLSLPVVEGAWVQVYTPADDDARRRLDTLLAMTEEQRHLPYYDHLARDHAQAG